MANPEHLARINAGIKEWNQWRDHNPLVNIDLSNSDLSRADLAGANLGRADISRADLRGTGFSRINLSTEKLSSADLSFANLSEANLSEANLRYVRLPGANLRRADLKEANLRDTYLFFADLSDASLFAANLSNAYLSGANLSGASLFKTIFGGADVSEANMTGAILLDTMLGNADLRGVKGLDSCQHVRRSTIGIDTFFRSKGQIPETFLRGCGVPEQFITYARSLVGKAIEFYSCFISYSTKDQEFADQLYADLQNNAVRCWFAPHDIQDGRKVHEQIDQAIRVYDRLLLILSEHSIGSNWVETEISKGRQREIRENRQTLFPVRLVGFEALREWECFDADTGKDSAREIREYFIPDFSNWKDHDSYKKAFDRLLHDLKAKPDLPAAN